MHKTSEVSLSRPAGGLNRLQAGWPIAALLAALPLGAQAQVNPSADAIRELNRQNQIIERQQQERLREDQQRALPQPGAPGGTDLKSIQPQIQVPDVGAGCRDIREVRIQGAADLPDTVAQGVQKEFAGRCLGAKDLEAILANITRSYIERGFVTTRAYLPAQDLRSGVLDVAVVDGTIERYELRNSGRAGAKVNIAGAFPASPGDRLNLRDLEQGIDQVNSLPSNSATLDLQPGSQPGQSVVVVNNQASFPLHLHLNWDNLGTPSTGRDGASATVSADGLLGLNENIAFTRRQSAPYDSEHHSELSALHVAVPWGYSTISYDVSESTYTNALHLPSGMRLDSEGRTLTQALGLDRVVFRDQASRVSLGARLSTQDSHSFLGGLELSSRALSTLDLGASAFTQLGGGILNGRLAWVQGLASFGALKDADWLPDDLPHAQAGKAVADLGYSRRFDTGPMPLVWSSQFSGQYSHEVLYGLQQFLVGGPSSVRGSLVNALSGDSGYFIRNELSLPWQRAVGEQNYSGRFYLGYDFGSVTNNAPGVPSGSMSGVALGAALQWRTASAEVFASRSLHLPGFFTPEGTLWGVRLSFAL